MIATHSTAQFIFSTLVTGYPTVPLQPRADEGEVGAKEGAGSGTPRHVDEHEQPHIDLSKGEIASLALAGAGSIRRKGRSRGTRCTGRFAAYWVCLAQGGLLQSLG
jgi:hypothetical protein